MIVLAWIIVGIVILSMILTPKSIGKERTVGDACGNIFCHLVFLAFLAWFLIQHYS